MQTMGMATLHTKDMEVTPKATVMMTTEVDMVMEVTFFSMASKLINIRWIRTGSEPY